MGTLLVLLTLVTTPANTDVKANTYHPTFTKMVAFINTERAKHGLPPVKTDPALMANSARHTQWMAGNNSLTHSSGVAEIIARGQTSVPSVIQDWMTSRKGHREIILGNYKYVGAAGYSYHGRLYWCMQFSGNKIKYSAPMRYIAPAPQYQSS